MKYKIQVECTNDNYRYSLLKKIFFKWKKLEVGESLIPFPKQVFDWQKQFNIPDNQIVITTVKKKL
jgi:hypothetical protein